MPKHVIILGAGASAGSRYPVANELRLWMSSKRHLADVLKRTDSPRSNPNLDPTWKPSLDEAFKAFTDPLKLFREGGFASVDEFCKLGSKSPAMIHEMRCWTRSVLACWNPEQQFEKSEYYGFVQNLFDSNLHDLRSDIAVLSFNYDVYLEFLLQRALKTRRTILGKVCQEPMGAKILPDDPADVAINNAVTGGFYSSQRREWLESDGFCVLKLHGSMAYPERNLFPGYHILFSEAETHNRLKEAFNLSNNKHVPPIVFPWEMISENGLCEAKDFPIDRRQDEFELFRGVWQRARKEVESATKISFVGISMHPFMEFAFNYLFKNKQGNVEVVVANQPIRYKSLPHPSDVVGTTFDSLCPAGRVRDFFDKQGTMQCDMRAVDSFKTFIAEEMGHHGRMLPK